VTRKRRGNKTNYERDRASGTSPYRKYVNWRKRWDKFSEDGLDSDQNRGILRLPDPGKCPYCGKKLIRGKHKVNNEMRIADE
jgi:5-methylcytosine-specific restriction endonuclease McrA